jgi:hypothetical protein
MDSTSKRSKNGAMFQEDGRTRAFLIIRRNLVPFREQSDGTCDLSENPGARCPVIRPSRHSAAAQRFGFPDITDVVIPNFCTNK